MTNLMERSKAAGYGEPLSREENDELYKRLIAGEKDAKDQMIQGNMALVIVRVKSLLRNTPQMMYFRDDLISAGLVGLCKAVDKMQKSCTTKKINPTGYIYTSIDNHLIEAIDEESTIVVPHRTQKRARQNDTIIEKPKFVDRKEADLQFAKLHSADRIAEYDCQEEINACCLDELDSKIIEMKITGRHTNAQIARELKVSSSTITVRLKKIRQRLVERCPEYARIIPND